ncbi:MAG: S26 family signal peptidase, partial [Solirubrobacterales bacterium]|nr:S26 family signal peptidase [Solirubrobacterales bacterium]
PSGDYFLMEDNRGAANDSRFWGPLPGAWIIGTVKR